MIATASQAHDPDVGVPVSVDSSLDSSLEFPPLPPFPYPLPFPFPFPLPLDGDPPNPPDWLPKPPLPPFPPFPNPPFPTLPDLPPFPLPAEVSLMKATRQKTVRTRQTETLMMMKTGVADDHLGVHALYIGEDRCFFGHANHTVVECQD